MSQLNPTGDRLKVALCTREYPPEVYGGAGVHVEYLAKELSEHVDLTVHSIHTDRRRPNRQTPQGGPHLQDGS